MFGRLWARTRGLFARLFRREARPGRFETGSASSWHGLVGTAPMVWPSRDYLVYIPSGHSLWRRSPLLVLCHGCRQSPEEIARGTRIAEFADRTGCVVLLPRQKDTANPWRCWNWFERRTMRGLGESAIVAAQIRRVRRRYRIDRKRVLVAGMSAGGALAAIVGLRFPQLVGAVVVHSGLACGAASSALTAITVMQRGPDQDIEGIAAAARAKNFDASMRIPLLALHGDADNVVAPRNAIALVRQYLRLNDHPALASAGDPAALPAADTEQRTLLPDGRAQTVREWRRDGRLIVRHIAIAGLGHAWSGGDATLPYNEAAPPDATALVGDFFVDAFATK